MFCSKCGKEVAEGTTFCPACGTAVAAAQAQAAPKKKLPFGRRPMKASQIIAALAAMVGMGICMSRMHNDEEAEKKEAAQFRPQTTSLINYVDKRCAGRSWAYKHMELDYTGRKVSATMFYESAAGPLTVVAETKLIAKYALDWLKKSGRNPMSEKIGVFVYAMGHSKGATGADQAWTIGSTDYNYTNDELEWSPGK